METVRDRLLRVQDCIQVAASRAGREPASVRLVAVSKTVPVEVIGQALAAGVRILGENRVQEAQDKIAALPGRAEWHLVGHLQTNKAKLAVQLFELIHSVDSLKLVQALTAAGSRRGRWSAA
jgi:uncharacterized pyridoxal phosphate-containing UPF0001 family protein